MPPLPIRSQLSRLTEPDVFWWATGIEDTFITAPHPVTGRTLDEYELTDHYRRWRADLDLMAELGVPTARYGVPWHRIQPEPNRWDWRAADEPLEHMLDLGIAPQVDLVHYGLPGWIEGAYLNPDYPRLVAEYAKKHWRDGLPLTLLFASLKAKDAAATLRPFKGVAAEVLTLPIEDHECRDPQDLAHLAESMGLPARAWSGLADAMTGLRKPARVLVFGSLYLAGELLALNGPLPD